jgi:hypothetical protein
MIKIKGYKNKINPKSNTIPHKSSEKIFDMYLPIPTTRSKEIANI